MSRVLASRLVKKEETKGSVHRREGVNPALCQRNRELKCVQEKIDVAMGGKSRSKATHYNPVLTPAPEYVAATTDGADNIWGAAFGSALKTESDEVRR